MILDEAIEIYTSNAEYERTHGSLQGCMDFKQLAEWLKELKQLRKQTKWVPVSEKLPDIDEEVLVDDGMDIFAAWWVDYGLEVGWHSVANSYDPDRPILAWMPLPEPYKAESEET